MPSEVIVPTFTGWTLAGARAKVLRKLRQTDTIRYSPTKTAADYDWIDDCLHCACQAFATKTQCLRTYAIIQLKAGYRTYRAPDGFIDIMGAYFYHYSYESGYQPIAIKSVLEMNHIYGDWRTRKDEKIEVIYVDRFHGTGAVLGVYPIPSADGDSTIFSAGTAEEYEWACPMFTNSPDYGMVIQADGTDKYILPNTTNDVTADLDVTSGNVLIEYYRLPIDLLEPEQYMEIPVSYQDDVIALAVSELLENNPEDSNEAKRAVALAARTGNVMKEYLHDMKTPLSGRNLRAATAVEGWIKNMDFRKRRY